jgi:hypothetical protein
MFEASLGKVSNAYQKKQTKSKRAGSSVRVLAQQSPDPEFNPYYYKKPTKQKSLVLVPHTYNSSYFGG